ncbi:MAG TPA: YihY/virulence factor BrkB family protein [Rhizomicrobium sp.]|jgi:membrane protein
MGKITHVWKLFLEGCEAFAADEALTRGAAIAFYAVTALAPVLYITALLSGLVFGQDAATGALAHELQHVAGPDGDRLVHAAIRNSFDLSQGIWVNVLSAVVLVVAASGLFGEMQSALNAIWKATPVPRRSIWRRIARDRAVSLLLVLALGFVLVGSTLCTAALDALGTRVEYVLPLGEMAARALAFVIGFVLTAVLFAAIYKVLPDLDLEWRDVGVGAVGTALLFQLGQFAIGLYLGQGHVAASYGRAGSLILLLLWVYYSSEIFLLGAEFTKVWAKYHGSQKHAEVPAAAAPVGA